MAGGAISFFVGTIRSSHEFIQRLARVFWSSRCDFRWGDYLGVSRWSFSYLGLGFWRISTRGLEADDCRSKAFIFYQSENSKRGWEEFVVQYIEAMSGKARAASACQICLSWGGDGCALEYAFLSWGWWGVFACYCYTRYVQLCFFQGAKLTPITPKASKVGNVRYFPIFDQDAIDEGIIKSWLEQSLALPGEKLWSVSLLSAMADNS